MYPPNSVKCSGTNKGEPLNELEKAFGTLAGFNTSSAILNDQTYLSSANASAVSGGKPICGAYGLDFESFNRSAIENGVNTADRSLPITLELTAGATDILTTVDVYCLCDAIFYVNLDGTCSVSV